MEENFAHLALNFLVKTEGLFLQHVRLSRSLSDKMTFEMTKMVLTFFFFLVFL